MSQAFLAFKSCPQYHVVFFMLVCFDVDIEIKFDLIDLVDVCMSGYAFCHALGYRAESWLGGRGWAHEVCGHIFEATPPGVKGHPGVNLP